MKKSLCICVCLVLILSVVSVAGADSGSLPSIKSLMQSGKATKRIEVSDNLDAYSLENDTFDDWNESNPKFLILERHSPEKEFTELVKYPPFSDYDGFPYEFNGYDIGESRVWLRGDLMQKIPSNFRAKSLQDATHLIIAEDIYYHARTLIVTDYINKDDDDNIPEFETTEEMVEYFQAHQPVISSMSYYPVFGSYAVVTAYETKTKRCAIFDSKEAPGKKFARNPEASAQWDNISNIISFMDMIENEASVNVSQAKSYVESLEYVPQEERDLWISLLNSKKYSYAFQMAEDYIWMMVEDLKALDSSQESRENYDLIIAERNLTALSLYVQHCDYSGFEKSIDLIKSSKEYLTSPDWSWLEEVLTSTVNELFGE